MAVRQFQDNGKAYSIQIDKLQRQYEGFKTDLIILKAVR